MKIIKIIYLKILIYFLVIKEKRYTLFAHYPICQHFINKAIWKIGNYYVCIGCLLFWSGFISASIWEIFILFILKKSLLSYYNFFIIICGCTIFFNIINIFINLGVKIHRIIRFLGGIGVNLYFLLILLPPYNFYKIFILFFSLIFYRTLSIIRRSRIIDICQTCEEYNQKDICNFFQKKIEEDKKIIKKIENKIKFLEI